MRGYKMLINGHWVDSSTGERFSSVNPYDQEVWAYIPQASGQDVHDAISAARYTFDNLWKKLSGLKRAELMYKLANLLDENAERISQLETTDNGKVIVKPKNRFVLHPVNIASLLATQISYMEKQYPLITLICLIIP